MVYPETVPRGVQVTCCWPGMRWKWSTASFKFQKMKVEFLKVQDINYQTSPDSLIWVLMSLLEVRTWLNCQPEWTPSSSIPGCAWGQQGEKDSSCAKLLPSSEGWGSPLWWLGRRTSLNTEAPVLYPNQHPGHAILFWGLWWCNNMTGLTR